MPRGGLALIEPMYYEYPEEKEAYECPGEYLFGRQLIVAPVTEKGDAHGMTVTKVWLPEGRYTDIFTGDVYAGGGRNFFAISPAPFLYTAGIFENILLLLLCRRLIGENTPNCKNRT